MYPINTRIYLSDLQSETKDQLVEAIIRRLRDDEEEMKLIEDKVENSIQEDMEVLEDLEETRKRRIETYLEETADDILNRTFYGEINIGE